MLTRSKKLTILLGVAAATIMLAVSVPHSGTISFTSAAMANEGGGGLEHLFRKQSRKKHRKRCKSQGYYKKDAVDFCTKKLGGPVKCGGKPRRWICVLK